MKLKRARKKLYEWELEVMLDEIARCINVN